MMNSRKLWQKILFIVLTLCLFICMGPRINAISSLPDLVEKCGPAVVMIYNMDGNKVQSKGSGFIVDPTGVIITNYHVIKDATAINVKLTSGKTYPIVKIFNLDKPKDICILKVDGSGLPSLKLGNSDKVKVGENCIAIGNPQGFENTVSNGLISDKRSYDDIYLLQTSAPISPGSSGGPLLNEQGEVIGITSLSWGEKNHRI